jgi:hypothetical protein
MDEISLSDARRLTERIRLMALTVGENIDKLKALVAEAKESESHIALGYASWQAYLADVLGETPMRLERDTRQALVAELTTQGMSTRAIAPIVGVDNATVHRDLGRVANATPAPAPVVEQSWSPDTGFNAHPFTGEIIEPPAPRAVEGMDGKTYKMPTKKARRAESPSAELTLINDIRLYLRTLASSPQVARLSDAGKQHLTDALQDAITQIERNK